MQYAIFMMKISVITATWNSASTVSDTFDSVLRQLFHSHNETTPEWELEYIVVDGNSQDNTVDIIKEYEPLFMGKMRWISEPDAGIYDAMNKGISMATGDVVGILNSDDFYTSFDVLTAVARTFKKDDTLDAVYGDVHYVKEDDITRPVRYYSSRYFRRIWMRMGFMPAHPSFYCKKSVYDKFKQNDGYFNTSYLVAADFENLLRMIFVGRIKIQYIWKDFVTMRLGGASTNGINSHKQIIKDHLRALKENGVYSNIFILSIRYIYKIGELIVSKFI